MAPFAEFAEELTDTVIDTQLRGVLNVSRPAWKAMAAGGGGRFVNVSSGAAFGGVPDGVGLQHGEDGRRRPHPCDGVGRQAAGIAANVISPSAKTRARYRASGRSPGAPSSPSGSTHGASRPMVGWLAHETCPLTGEWFTVGGGHFARVGLTDHRGFLDRDATIDSIAAHVDEIMLSASTPLGIGSEREWRG